MNFPGEGSGAGGVRQDIIKGQLNDRQEAEQLLGGGRPESCLETFAGSGEEKAAWEWQGQPVLASAGCAVAAPGLEMCLLAAVLQQAQVLHQAQVLLAPQILYQPQVLFPAQILH